MCCASGMIDTQRSSTSPPLTLPTHSPYSLSFNCSFPAHSFPPEICVYHPPYTTRHTNIAKITSCDDTFAALSSGGEVFTFSVSSPSDGEASKRDRAAIKPQLVWALRKQFSGVRVCGSITMFRFCRLTHLLSGCSTWG